MSPDTDSPRTWRDDLLDIGLGLVLAIGLAMVLFAAAAGVSP